MATDTPPDLPTSYGDATARPTNLARAVNDLNEAMNALYSQVQGQGAGIFTALVLAGAAAPSSSVPRNLTDLNDVQSATKGTYYMPVWDPRVNQFVFLDFSDIVAGTGAGQVANWPSLPSIAMFDLAPNVWTKAGLDAAGRERVRCLDTNFTGYDATGGSGTGTWFVAPDGNDSTGNGTASTPYRTITKAVTAMTAGDRIVCRAGTYREALGTLTNGTTTLSKNATIQAYPHEEVWLKGSIDVTNTAAAEGFDVAWTAVANGWRLDLTVAGTVSGTNVFTATSGYPFHAGFVGAKVTGAGSGITISSLKSATNGGADVGHYQGVNLAGTATNGAATITVGVGAAMNRTTGTSSSGSVGYDAAHIATTAYNQTANEPTTIWADGVKLTRVVFNAATVLAAGQYMYDATNQKVYLGSDPATFTKIELGVLGKWVGDSTTAGITHKYWGLGFVHFGSNTNTAQADYAAIWLDGAGCEVISCAVAYNHGYALSFRGHNWICRGNLILHNGCNGVHSDVTDDWLVEANRIAYNHNEFYEFGIGKGNFLIGTYGALKLVHPTSGGVARLNIIHDNYANGFWYDRAPGGGDNVQSQPSEAVDVTIVRNIIVNNGGFGVQLEIHDRPIIAGNVIVGNGRDAIKLSSCPSKRTWHNTCYGNGWAPQATGAIAGRLGGLGKWWNDTATYWTEHIDWSDNHYTIWVNNFTGAGTGAGDIKNNVFIATNPTGATGAGPSVISTRNEQSNVSQNGEDMVSAQDYNWYGRVTANQPQKLVEIARASATSPTRYNTLALWKAGLGSNANNGGKGNRDTHSVEQNGIADIQAYLAAPNAGDYSIVAACSADIAGEALPADVVAALNAATDSAYQLALTTSDTPKIGAHTDWLLVPTWV